MPTTTTIPNQFGDDLWNLLPIALKQNEDELPKEQRELWKLMQVVGKQLENYKVNVRQVLINEYFAQIATLEGLKLIGANRKLPLMEGETTEEYRLRLITAWNFWNSGGTVGGLETVGSALGFTGITIDERVDTVDDFDVRLGVPETVTVTSDAVQNLFDIATFSMRPSTEHLRTIILTQTVNISIPAASVDPAYVTSSTVGDEADPSPMLADEAAGSPFLADEAAPGTRLDITLLTKFALGTGTPPSMLALGSQWVMKDVTSSKYEGDVSVFECRVLPTDGAPSGNLVTEMGLATAASSIQVTSSLTNPLPKLTTTSIYYTFKITLT